MGRKHTVSAPPLARKAQKKKRPHFWGHHSKRQKGGKSGKTLQGVVLSSRATIRELSRTMSCGEGHGACVRPLYCSEIKHLPRQRISSQRLVDSIPVRHSATYVWHALVLARQVKRKSPPVRQGAYSCPCIA